MVYNDEQVADLSQIEDMAKAYNSAMKEKGFVFVNLDELGKNLLAKEVLEILFKLRASYRAMKGFLSSNIMYDQTCEHIEKIRTLFLIEDNKGFVITCNTTKCFLNAISLEQQLCTKLLLLAQKCTDGEMLISLLFERNEKLAHILKIENCMFTSKNSFE